jgi:hypothetical protein
MVIISVLALIISFAVLTMAQLEKNKLEDKLNFDEPPPPPQTEPLPKETD